MPNLTSGAQRVRPNEGVLHQQNSVTILRFQNALECVLKSRKARQDFVLQNLARYGLNISEEIIRPDQRVRPSGGVPFRKLGYDMARLSVLFSHLHDSIPCAILSRNLKTALVGGNMFTLIKNALDIKSCGLKGRGIFISAFQVPFLWFRNFIIANRKAAVYDMNGLFNIPDLTDVIFTFVQGWFFYAQIRKSQEI